MLHDGGVSLSPREESSLAFRRYRSITIGCSGSELLPCFWARGWWRGRRDQQRHNNRRYYYYQKTQISSLATAIVPVSPAALTVRHRKKKTTKEGKGQMVMFRTPWLIDQHRYTTAMAMEEGISNHLMLIKLNECRSTILVLGSRHTT